VGADFEVDDLAAAGAPVVGAAGAAVAGAAAAAVESEAGLLFDAFCTPPWPLHAPRPEAVEVVPSLQVVGVADAAGAAGAEVAGAAGAPEAAFWTPPCPLHAPRPVAVEVVPSLQVVGALGSAACAGNPNMNAIRGAARSPTRFVFFMTVHSPRSIRFTADCKWIGVKPILSLGS
jgi:hypothetical protein